MEFLNIKREKEDHKEKVLTKGTIKGKVFYYVQAVEYDGLTGLMVENRTEDCADYEDAEMLFKRALKDALQDRDGKVKAIIGTFAEWVQYARENVDFKPNDYITIDVEIDY